MKKKKAKKVAKKSSKVVSKKTNFGQPYGDRVLVKPAPAEVKTPSGIIIPDTAQEKSQQGIVVAVGEGRKNDDGKLIPLSVKVGDRIMYSYGEEIKINGTEYILISENSITYIF